MLSLHIHIHTYIHTYIAFLHGCSVFFSYIYFCVGLEKPVGMYVCMYFASSTVYSTIISSSCLSPHSLTHSHSSLSDLTDYDTISFPPAFLIKHTPTQPSLFPKIPKTKPKTHTCQCPPNCPYRIRQCLVFKSHFSPPPPPPHLSFLAPVLHRRCLNMYNTFLPN